jgi:hypothetical protein
MPWELGYFDGLKKGRVAILPVSESVETGFKGQEYLGLYNYVDIFGAGAGVLWINDGAGKFTSLDRWLHGEEPTHH